jgi:hypothetical protein
MSIFYRPSDSVAADFIPFFWRGDYHLFHLRDCCNPSQRVASDHSPRPPFMLERPVRLPPGQPTALCVLVDSTCLVACLNDRVALSCRMYEHRSGNWGRVVTKGSARFRNLSTRTRHA